MADIFGMGTSALLSLQQAISTTGHNISNVNTEGYSRQSVSFTTRDASQTGVGFIGNGVDIGTIRRSYDSFLADQVLVRTSSFNSLSSYHNLAAQMDGLLANVDSGLNSAMQGFFDAMQGVANDPTSLPARQVLLGQAQTLVDRVGYLEQSFDSFDAAASSSIQSAVEEINGLSQGIAQLNTEIAVQTLSNPLNPPNDLLDKRDVLIGRLAEKVGVSTITQDDGSVNVLIGNGQPLVVGAQVQLLEAVPNTFNPARMEIGFAGLTSNTTIITDQIRGGELQGVLDFRKQILDPARNELGRLVHGITDAINGQHRLGLDLNGQLGLDFFSPLSGEVQSNPANSGTASLSIAIDDVASLGTADYRASYDGSQWVLRNMIDDSVQTFAGMPISIDGFTVSMAGTPSAGDQFMLRPISGGMGQFGLNITDVNQIAAASPMRSQLSLSNSGNADVSNLQVNDTAGLPLAGPITLTFNPDALGTGVPGWDVTGGPTGPVAYDPATDSGGISVSFPGYGDVSFDVSGIPNAGDTIVLENNSGGIGDNSNALLLAGLQSSRFMDGGSATLSDMYSRSVANVGVRTNQASVNLSTEEGLLDNAVEAQRGVSGVNLDEEAANLLRYQQAYQAAAQIISAADEIFQSLLAATR